MSEVRAQEARRAYQREWRKKNRERLNAYMREWRKANPEKHKANEMAYWLRKAEKMKEESKVQDAAE